MFSASVMAVKRRRRIMQNISSLSHESLMENGKNYRRSRSDLSNISFPTAAQKNRNSAQHNNDIGSTKKKLKQVAHSNLQSSFYNSPEIRQKENKSKQGQAQANSLHSLVTSTLDRTRRRNGCKMQRKLSTKLNKNSSQLSLNITLETSILTRSQRKLVNSNMELLRKSKDHISDICSMNPVTYLPKVSGRKSRSLVRDVEIINSQTETSRPTSLENLKTPVSAYSLRKSLDTTTNAAKQNKNMSTHPIVDCLMLSNSSGTVSLVCNNVLSQEKVKHRRTQRISDEYSEIGKRKYHLRSQSEKIFNPLKPAIPSRKRMTSLPIDDLVCTTSKPVSKKKEKSKGLPKKTILLGKQTSSIDSKKTKSTKRKGDINNHSVNIDSNLIIKYRSTRSSLPSKKSMDSMISLPSKKIVKKSKRHTFPMSCLNGKYSISSQNHPRTNQEANDRKLNSIVTLNHSNSFNHKNVPIDDLTVIPNSFFARKYRSRSKCATSLPIQHISTQMPPIQDKNQVSSKSNKATKLEKEKTNYQEKSSLGSQNSIPSKGTLKRKRWIFNTLKERNDGYEDDIFETKKFDKMKAALEILDDESDTTDNSIATPKCGFILTPSLPKKTPLYKECISSKELLEARKVAEEYLFRRNKKWKSEIKDDFDKQSSVNTTGTSESEKDLPEKKKLDYSEVLQNVINVQKDIEKLTQESEEEDAYFSEASD